MESTLTLPQLNNVSEIDVVYKKKVTVKMSERPLIKGSRDSYEVFMHYWNQEKIDLLEEFKVMFLSRSNRVLQICPISSGGLTATVADPRLILAIALHIGGLALILAHNHPSNSTQPSNADVVLTGKITAAAKLHDIGVLDHIILTSEGYFSFADEGLI